MKIQFLGTGAAEGVPALFCVCPNCEEARKEGKSKMRCSALVNDKILIDISPDLFTQAKSFDLPAVRDVLITHTHPDHFDINAIKLWARSGKNITLWGSKDMASRVVALDDTGNIKVEILKAHTPTTIQGITITPILARHIPDEQCFLYALDDSSGTILYGNDTEYLADKILLSSIVYDMVSLDCCHMDIEEIKKTKQILQENGQTKPSTIFYGNHYSHCCSLSIEGMLRELSSFGFLLAYDGLVIKI